jgi:hypothetical protein
MADEDEKRVEEEEETKDSVDEETQDETTEEETSSDDDEESEADGDEPSEFIKRFPQFKGETLEDYTQRLEDAYTKSTDEGKRLFDEVETLKSERLDQIANTATEDAGEAQTTDESFGDRYARSEVRKRNRQSFDTFVEDHSELQTDPALAERMKHKVTLLVKTAFEEEGEVPDMDELLRGAWAMLAPTGTDIETRNELKERTGMSKTSGVKKRDKISKISPEQIATAKRMYPNKSDKELATLLAKYVT